jgi:pyruvate dehydrogenase E1 component
VSWVETCLKGAQGPVIAASDYVSALADLIRPYVPGKYVALGTDGFGRSDTREALRIHFEVSPEQIAYAALHGLCLTGAAGREELTRALGELGIDPERPDPLHA